MKKVVLILMIAFSIVSCNSNEPKTNEKKSDDYKVGVLLVNHGSHSKLWRDMLLDVQKKTEDKILANPKISKVLTGYMEYNGPSIADQLKKFDKEGYDEIIIVPLFLTVSSHTESDIQNIVGVKKNPDVIADLKEENIEIYSPKARVIITPLLDFPNLLKKNIARRYKALNNGNTNNGLVLVAYGSTPYNQQWIELIEDIGKYMKINAGVENISYAWCGHIVNYSTEPTTNAINQILEMEDHAVVIPVLVAIDSDFQNDIIQTGVNLVKNHEAKVSYKQDAILPDDNLNNWVVNIINETIK